MNGRPKVSVLTSLYKCEKYLSLFFEHVNKLVFTNDIELLLLHNEPQKNESVLISEKLKELPFIKHIIIPKREPLYKTWNRGIKIAQGDYICIWNVDDIRNPDSIYHQMQTLNKNPEVMMTYGDFYYMYEYGKPSEDLVKSPDFDINHSDFLINHHIGCFPMWRKSLHQSIGYFDEQFRLVGDFDFQIRASLKHKLRKTTDVNLGYYLENDPSKLSSNYILQHKERNLVYRRYAIYHHLNWIFLIYSLKYKKNYIKYDNKYHKLKLSPFFRLKRLHLSLLSVIDQPRNIIAFIKHGILKL